MEGSRSALVIQSCSALRLYSNLFYVRIGLVIGETTQKDSGEPPSSDKQLLPLSSP